MFAKANLVQTVFVIAALITSCNAAISQLDVMNTAVARGVTKVSVATMRTTFSAPQYQPNLALFQAKIGELNKKHPALHATSDSAYKCAKTCADCVSCIQKGRQMALDDLYIMASAMAACFLPLVGEATCAPILAAAVAECAKKEAEFCIAQNQPLTCKTDCSFATCAAAAKKTTRNIVALEFSG